MQQIMQIDFRDIAHSPGLETYLTEKIDKLTKIIPSIISCHVIIGQSQKHKHQGKLYNIRIHITVPERTINSVDMEDENPYTAAQRALDSIKTQLNEYRDKIQLQIKTHPNRKCGKIVRLFPNEHFGFIQETMGDDEYYFGLGALHNTRFTHLKIGDKVHFVPNVGHEGLQAHRVSVYA